MSKCKRDPLTAHLGPVGSEFFEENVLQFKIEDAARLSILLRGAECLDRLRQAQDAITEHGLLIDGKANPALRVEKEARDGFYAAMRQLKLGEPKRGPGRPPQHFGCGVGYEQLEALGYDVPDFDEEKARTLIGGMAVRR
jgi:hypothetical protein